MSGASAGLGYRYDCNMERVAPPFFSYRQSRNDGDCSVNGDGLGKIQFIAHDGTGYNNYSTLH